MSDEMATGSLEGELEVVNGAHDGGVEAVGEDQMRPRRPETSEVFETSDVWTKPLCPCRCLYGQTRLPWVEHAL